MAVPRPDGGVRAAQVAGGRGREEGGGEGRACVHGRDGVWDGQLLFADHVPVQEHHGGEEAVRPAESAGADHAGADGGDADIQGVSGRYGRAVEPDWECG